MLTTGKEEGEKGAGKIPLNKLQFFTPSYFPYFLLLGKIKPDAYLRRKTTKGIAHGLLFVLDAYIPKLLLRFTIKRIFDTLSDENWEEDSILSLSFLKNIMAVKNLPFILLPEISYITGKMARRKILNGLLSFQLIINKV